MPGVAVAFWIAFALAVGVALGYGIRASSHPDKVVTVKRAAPHYYTGN